MVLYVIEEERYADIWDTTRCSTQWMERSNCRNCLSGQRATRYPERFARIDGSNCSTVLSTLDCFQTQLPSAAAAATAEENKRGWACKRRENERERQSRRERDSSCWALSLCKYVRLCAWICSLSHCVIYYQQTAMPVTSERQRERERATATPIKLRRVLCSL